MSEPAASGERAARSGTARARLAYLCSLYPAISHTFVLREVDALRRLGVAIDTFSIHRAAREQLLSDADRLASATTHAILPARWPALLAVHLKLLVNAPRAFASTLAFALRLAAPGLRGRLWQAFYFTEAVLLWSECRRRGIRHIHAHLANPAADVALLASALGSKLEPERPWSWSFTMHGPTEFFDVARFRLEAKVRHARFVVCISHFARSQLMALSDPASWRKLHVVHCGVPLHRFERGAHGPAGEQPMVLCVGRLVPEKGQAVLLGAVALLAERGLDLRVTLAGEGPSRPALERLADDLGVASRTTFSGAVGQDDIHALYAGASVFCLPSFAEGVPVVLMEAMAMGLPVVSTRVAGIPELVEDGRTGLLVAPGHADELAAALRRLLTQPSLAGKLTRHARDKVRTQFNSAVSAEALLALFAGELGWATPADGSVAVGGDAATDALPATARDSRPVTMA